MYTPGPWTWESVQAEQSVTEHSLSGPDVLCRYWHDKPPSPDACLIAAAPTLLEALEALLSDMAVNTLEDAARTDPNDTDSAKTTAAKFRKAYAAIRAAKGD